MNISAELYKKRRQDLVAALKKEFPDKEGIIVLIGRFEQERHCFRQESSFYYLTGVEEPGSIVVMDLVGNANLFIPATTVDRSQWLEGALKPDEKTAQTYGFAKVAYLGQAQPGYNASPLAPRAAYETFLDQLKNTATIFTCVPASIHQYIEQKFMLERFTKFAPELFSNLVDISGLVARMRRKKTLAEIELMYQAAEVTVLAQEAAARALADGAEEAQVQASLEYIFTEHGGKPAFPSIVASGKQSTILHYCRNNQIMHNGDLVVVDIGVELAYYCADLTRTYPVSGRFTQRQKEVYTAVLETQEYIASLAKPGLWLSNKEQPEQSLQHLAIAFLEKKGYAKYFMHGVSHFLGLDVHDVGNGAEPLQEGDVITIEPGIYIPAERIGIRIEDNYWVVQDGVECLSGDLPKSIEEVERMAQASFEGVEAPVDDAFADGEFVDEDDGEIQ